VHDQLRSGGPRAIIVMGVSGSGKSTLGGALASELECAFLEGDEFHSPEAVAKMRSGTPLTDEDRWPWLDRMGQAISARAASDGIVVAACSALRRVYRERLRKAITAPVSFVLMDADRDELTRRITGRPGHYMPPSLLTSQLNTLERPDPDERILTLDSRQPVPTLCARTVTWLLGGSPSTGSDG
jgi:gluconokinase